MKKAKKLLLKIWDFIRGVQKSPVVFIPDESGRAAAEAKYPKAKIINMEAERNRETLDKHFGKGVLTEADYTLGTFIIGRTKVGKSWMKSNDVLDLARGGFQDTKATVGKINKETKLVTLHLHINQSNITVPFSKFD